MKKSNKESKMQWYEELFKDYGEKCDKENFK